MSATSENQPHRLAKKARFLARMKEKDTLRKLPGNCCRCAKPNTSGNGLKQCPACTRYASEYRMLKRSKIVDAKSARVLESRICSLEIAIANLQLKDRNIYKRAYQRGRATGMQARVAQSYLDAMPRATAQELHSISHAFSSGPRVSGPRVA